MQAEPDFGSPRSAEAQTRSPNNTSIKTNQSTAEALKQQFRQSPQQASLTPRKTLKDHPKQGEE